MTARYNTNISKISTREVDTFTPDQILENWKKRTQDQKGYLVDPCPLTVSPWWSWPDTPAAQARALLA